MPDTAVKAYNSTMSGAPSLNGTAGSLVSLLDACLKDGFGSVTLDSLVVSGNVATATKSAGHNLAMIGNSGPVVTIAGATPSGLNGEWRIASVPSSTTFTFATSGISNQTATGTITAQRAPLGWTKPYSGTNKGAYLPAVQYVQCYLRVQDDSSTPTSASGRWAKVRGYESMSDVDTGTGLFPTAAQSTNALTWWKSSTSDSTARPWWLVGDAGIFYLGMAAYASYPAVFGGCAFGDINSIKGGDAYSSFLHGFPAGTDTAPSTHNSNVFTSLGAYNATQAGRYLARTYAQSGTAVAAGWMGDNGVSTIIGGVGGLAYPHPPDNGFLFAPIAVVEGSIMRSRALPGFYQPLHNAALSHLDVLTDLPDFAGRTFQIFGLSSGGNNSAQCVIDITGPWR